MTSLAFCAGSVPQVTDRRCVFTADAPPPCPIVWRDNIMRREAQEHPSRCVCIGSGVAPSGTDIVIWTPQQVVTTSQGMHTKRAGVVVAGKLDGVSDELARADPVRAISLSECFLIDPPITEWPRLECLRARVDYCGPVTHDITTVDGGPSATLGLCWDHVVIGMAAGMKPTPITSPVAVSVASLPAGWSVCPVGLEQAIEERA